jgi:hypothetical protein
MSDFSRGPFHRCLVEPCPCWGCGTGTTRWLVFGVIDSTDATAARITSPSGESGVAATGPVDQHIEGRFILVDVVVEDGLVVKTDEITVEDASP